MKKLLINILFLCIVGTSIFYLSSDDFSHHHVEGIIDFESVDSLSKELKSRDIDCNNSEAYDINILLSLKDPAVEDGIDLSAESIVIQDGDNVNLLLKQHREMVKEHYTSYNENIVSKIGLDRYDYYASFYSPYIEITFDSLSDYDDSIEDIVEIVTKNYGVISSATSYVDFSTTLQESAEDDDTDTSYYPLDEAFSDIGVSTTIATGYEISVGIIDNEMPYYIDHLYNGLYHLSGGPPDISVGGSGLHASVISAIIGGQSGIANNVNFYFEEQGDSIADACNKLINSYNVNIINISLGDYYDSGYVIQDDFIDHIVYTTGCTIVISAGNTGEYISSPGRSLNAITVGATNLNLEVSDFSSYKVSEDFEDIIIKPDVVAPGECLWDISTIPNVNDGIIGHSGTSYATPMVVGVIALLMENYPTLISHPSLVKAALHMGAQKLPSQTQLYDDQAGFGLVNYQNTSTILSVPLYNKFEIPSTATNEAEVSTFDVNIPYLHDITVIANTTISPLEQSCDTDIISPIFTQYAIKIWDNNTSQYVASSTKNSNVDYLVFTNQNPNSTSFRIDIVLEADNASGRVENGSYAYKVNTHSHEYDIFEPYSSLQHRCYCECGAYLTNNHTFIENVCTMCDLVHEHEYNWAYYSKTQHIEKCACGIVGTVKRPHVLRSSDTGRYRTCIECNALIDMNTGGGLINSTKVMVSLNGSYIMPNGIIILVDEDIDAYLNGDLIFYDPNENVESI